MYGRTEDFSRGTYSDGVVTVKFIRLFVTVYLALLLISAEKTDFLIKGKVESLRSGGYITLIISETPDKSEYLIINNNIVIGRVHSLRLTGYSGDKGRYLAVYELTERAGAGFIKAGTEIVLKPSSRTYDKHSESDVFQEKAVYKTVIISQLDKREMVLIPRGKFLMGSNSGDEDEYPEHMVNLTEYYIDRYEVSNEDYRKYADLKAISYPVYWKGKITPDSGFNDLYFSNLPVIVSYHEAAGYARWCGKRLPDEMEWEKAARIPPVPGKNTGWSVYTWGNTFRDGISNTEEFWTSNTTGTNLKALIKEKYMLTELTSGPIPVDIYDKDSASYYGIVHMDGNVTEWTSSWYKGYEMTRKKDKRYGTQYKVIKGGSYNLGKNEARVPDRKIGGIPDLYSDRIAGFRCVKDVTVNDRIKD